MLIAVASTSGLALSPANVAAWASVMLPIVVEVGSSCGLLVAQMQRTTRETAVAAGGTPARETVTSAKLTDNGRSGSNSNIVKNDDGECSCVAGNGDGQLATSVPVTAAKTKILELVASNGGHLRGAQRSMAKQLGVLLKNCNLAIHELAEEGRLIVNTTNRGTTLQLATA